MPSKAKGWGVLGMEKCKGKSGQRIKSAIIQKGLFFYKSFIRFSTNLETNFKSGEAGGNLSLSSVASYSMDMRSSIGTTQSH